MRSRKEIESKISHGEWGCGSGYEGSINSHLILEVVLDIRDLLLKQTARGKKK